MGKRKRNVSTKSPGPTNRQKKRLKMKTLIEEGHHNADIIKKTGCSKNTVKRWRKKLAEADSDDDDVILSQERSGRPKTATNPENTKAVIKYSKDKRGRSTRKTAKEMTRQGRQDC